MQNVVQKCGLAACSAAAFLFAQPVAAQAPVPENCTAKATVQKNSCVVEHFFKCDGDWVTHSYSHGVLDETYRFTKDWRMIGMTFSASDTNRFDFVANPGSGPSLTELFESGSSAEKQVATINTNIIKDRIYDMTGSFTLSDETVELSGHEFRRLSFERVFTRQQGAGGLAFSTDDTLVSSELNLLVTGDFVRRVNDTVDQTIERTPQSIALEGDSGFLTMEAEHGC